jgi:hypothetical protein
LKSPLTRPQPRNDNRTCLSELSRFVSGRGTHWKPVWRKQRLDPRLLRVSQQHTWTTTFD